MMPTPREPQALIDARRVVTAPLATDPPCLRSLALEVLRQHHARRSAQIDARAILPRRPTGDDGPRAA